MSKVDGEMKEIDMQQKEKEMKMEMEMDKGVLEGVVLEVEGEHGAATKGVATRVLHNGEGSRVVQGALPDVLLVVVGLRGDGDLRDRSRKEERREKVENENERNQKETDLVGNKESGVESDTELADLLEVAAAGRLLEELSSAGLGDVAEVVGELLGGHADTIVADVKELSLLEER